MRSGEAGDGALFYLAQIAESSGRQGGGAGDLPASDRILDGRRRRASRRPACCWMRTSAPRPSRWWMTSPTTTPTAPFDMVVQKAHLLADHGDTDGALALLSAASQSYPHHPTLEYERATMLERAGQTRDSLQAFEGLLAERPEDPTVLNALGYTLADHREQLPRAEKLIRQALQATPGQSGSAGQPGLGAPAARGFARGGGYSRTCLHRRTGSGHRGPLGRGTVGERFAGPGAQGAERCAGPPPGIRGTRSHAAPPGTEIRTPLIWRARAWPRRRGRFISCVGLARHCGWRVARACRRPVPGRWHPNRSRPAGRRGARSCRRAAQFTAQGRIGVVAGSRWLQRPVALGPGRYAQHREPGWATGRRRRAHRRGCRCAHADHACG